MRSWPAWGDNPQVASRTRQAGGTLPRRLLRGASVAAALVLWACAASVAAAPHEQRIQPAGLPFSFVIPVGWNSQAFGAGPLAFQTFSVDRTHDLEIATQSPAPAPAAFPAAFARVVSQHVLATDPTAAMSAAHVKMYATFPCRIPKNSTRTGWTGPRNGAR